MQLIGLKNPVTSSLFDSDTQRPTSKTECAEPTPHLFWLLFDCWQWNPACDTERWGTSSRSTLRPMATPSSGATADMAFTSESALWAWAYFTFAVAVTVRNIFCLFNPFTLNAAWNSDFQQGDRANKLKSNSNKSNTVVVTTSWTFTGQTQWTVWLKTVAWIHRLWWDGF